MDPPELLGDLMGFDTFSFVLYGEKWNLSNVKWSVTFIAVRRVKVQISELRLQTHSHRENSGNLIKAVFIFVYYKEL